MIACAAALLFGSVRLFGVNQPLEQSVSMPFVDRFG